MVMVTGALCPGLRVTEVEEKLVGQPDGCIEARLKVLAAHAAESLLVTDKLYAVLLPG